MRLLVRTAVVIAGITASALLVVGCAATTPRQTVCTQEAKICPDGSAVGRTGPSCEFAACPDTIPFTENWQTVEQSGVTLRYPQVTTMYMHPQDWPPSVTVERAPYSCDSENEERMINGRQYCIHAQNEGAAGSVYTDYLYIAPRNGGSEAVVLRFTIRATQCYNYDDPKKTECLQERAAFSPDQLADSIVRNIQ